MNLKLVKNASKMYSKSAEIPAVPTQAKVADRTTISRSASSLTMRALLPPNSKRCLPNRSWTAKATFFPTGVLPVKETNLIRLSAAIA